MSYNLGSSVGKITVLTASLGVFVIFMAFFIDSHNVRQFQTAMATSTVNTSVMVLNTAPAWSVNAQESNVAGVDTKNDEATPTNSGDIMYWSATADDSSNDSYYLLICSTNATATPSAVLNGPPTCHASGFQIAISSLTTDNTEALAATTTTELFAHSTAWFAYICDAIGSSGARCNTNSYNTIPQQGSGNFASPFVVNHYPTFIGYWNNSMKFPGQAVTWSATSTDPVDADGDVLDLFVCKTNSFATSTRTCNGGEWCHSTGAVTSNPSCVIWDPISSLNLIHDPTPDNTYGAYGFVVDEHNHGARYPATGFQGTNSPLIVGNTTPTVTNITLNDTDDSGALVLTQAEGQTTGFSVKFTVSDQNSCIANSSTTPEIIHTAVNVFRSDKNGIASTTGQYNPNFAYTHAYHEAYGATGWNLVCTQDANTCMGEGDSSVNWTCTFPLWYVASPTDTNTPWTTNTWKASVAASDKLYATSSEVEGTTPNEVQSAMYFDVATTSIAYGALEPNTGNSTLSISTDLSATGNTGLNERLFGDDMCVTYPSCTGYATSTIPVTAQKYSVTQDNAYGTYGVDGGGSIRLQLDDGLGALLALHVQKTTNTTTPQAKNTYWGIFVPNEITFSGNYIGENSIIGTVSDPGDW